MAENPGFQKLDFVFFFFSACHWRKFANLGSFFFSSKDFYPRAFDNTSKHLPLLLLLSLLPLLLCLLLFSLELLFIV